MGKKLSPQTIERKLKLIISRAYETQKNTIFCKSGDIGLKLLGVVDLVNKSSHIHKIRIVIL